ncbi:MAG: response regulator [Acidobacteria bacterium]|nr:response regulator [Acidobacteriota bacterium]
MSEPQPARAPVIAIIDDEQDIITYLRVALEDHGFRVVATTDPASAPALLEQACPDLICLDILMPEHTGLALYAEIMGSPRLASVPVVILSGLNANDELLNQVWNTNNLPAPASFIEKPVDIEHLLRTLRAVLGQQVGVAP